MATSPEPLHRVDPERLLHQHGEALLRRDFADQSAQDDQLRWWHTRSLHSAYGIAEGLTVKGLLPGGQAKVSPGVAFDVVGRELILNGRGYINVPSTDGELLLVLSYHRSAVTCDDLQAGLCQEGPVAHSGVRLRWVRRAAFSLRDGVPLAILNERVECSAPWSRPLARSQRRPRIVHGLEVIRDESQFSPWTIEIGEREIELGVQLDVETTSAGFTDTPCYFVELTVHPADAASLPFLFAVARNHIHAPQPHQFTLRLLSPPRITGHHAVASTAFRPHHAIRAVRADEPAPEPTELRISWLGVQHLEPSVQPDDLVLLRKAGNDHELHS